jgi:hypothetical protein
MTALPRLTALALGAVLLPAAVACGGGAERPAAFSDADRKLAEGDGNPSCASWREASAAVRRAFAEGIRDGAAKRGLALELPEIEGHLDDECARVPGDTGLVAPLALLLADRLL